MKIRKSLAGVAAIALASTGIAVVTAPAANAFSGSITMNCSFYAGDSGTGSSPSTWTGTLGLTQSPASPAPGQTVTVTLTGSTGGTNGPVPVEANTLRLEADLVGTGAAPATLHIETSAPPVGNPGGSSTAGTPATGTYPTAQVLDYAPLPAWTITGSYVAAGSGPASLALSRLRFDAVAFGGLGAGNADTYCSAAANPSAPAAYDFKASPITSTTLVESYEVDARTIGIADVTNQSANNYARVGITFDPDGAGPSPAVTRNPDVIELDSNNQWANGAAQVDICDSGATATTCANAVSLGSVTIAGGSFDTQTVSMGTTAISAGLHDLRVLDSAGKAKTVPITVLGTRAITISPANGGPGASTAVSGTNFDTGSTVAIDDLTSAFAPGSGATVTVTASATGTISGSFVVGSNTARVYAAEAGADAAAESSNLAVFTVNSDQCQANLADGVAGGAAEGTNYCLTKQNVTATVNPGSLTQQASAFGSAGYTSTLIPLGPVTTSTAAQTLNGNINPITITDARGGSAVWALTASVTTTIANGTGGSIANNLLAIGGVTCAPQAGSAAGITSGAGGNFGTTQTICDATTNTATSAGGTKGGQWVANAPVTLTVPAYQATGSYSGTITFTLT